MSGADLDGANRPMSNIDAIKRATEMACTHPDAMSMDSLTEDAGYWYCPDCSASGVLGA